MTKIGTALLLATVIAAGFADTASSNGPCGRGKVKVIASKFHATVYVRRGFDGPTTELCDRGRRSALDSGGSIGRVQYASVAITRDYIGYATQYCDTECRTRVSSVSRDGSTAGVFGLDPDPFATEVSRLRVGQNGAITWISCQPLNVSPPNAHLHRLCRSPRRERRVYVLPPNPVPDPNAGGPPRPPTLLDSGRGITPFSLGISKKRVIWRHHGRLRSASIPPPREPSR